MSLAVELSGEVEARLRDRARLENVSPESLDADLLSEALKERAGGSDLPGGYVRPTAPPPWLAEVRPQSPTPEGAHWSEFVVGRWPGEESEAELLAMEKVLDDEDSGRRSRE